MFAGMPPDDPPFIHHLAPQGVLKLAPQMASRRLLVLAFVRAYIARWGASPSYGEIAAGVGASPTRVRDAVKSLARAGLLHREPGPRGLSLPSDEEAARRILHARGFTVSRGGACGAQSTLHAGPVLDYIAPDPKSEAGGDGEQERFPEKQRRRQRR